MKYGCSELENSEVIASYEVDIKNKIVKINYLDGSDYTIPISGSNEEEVKENINILLKEIHDKQIKQVNVRDWHNYNDKKIEKLKLNEKIYASSTGVFGATALAYYTEMLINNGVQLEDSIISSCAGACAVISAYLFYRNSSERKELEKYHTYLELLGKTIFSSPEKISNINRADHPEVFKTIREKIKALNPNTIDEISKREMDKIYENVKEEYIDSKKSTEEINEDFARTRKIKF